MGKYLSPTGGVRVDGAFSAQTFLYFRHENKDRFDGYWDLTDGDRVSRVVCFSLVRRLFAGCVPRVTFISLGGFIFLGAYEKARRTLL